MLELVLVSQSPRRRQILEEAGYKFQRGIVKVSENIDENLNLGPAVEEIARAKAQAYLIQSNHMELKGKIILSADTMVFLQGKPLGKPKDYIEAEKFLRQLSTKTHSVITGVAAYNFDADQWWIFHDHTEICFHELSDQEIKVYVESGEASDKAGAYGIQGSARKFVKQIQGSFLNVVGFPLEKFESGLMARGWHVAKRPSR